MYQLRAGHWILVPSYFHRIGGHAPRNCQQCTDLECPAALCEVCQEEADTPIQVLLRCPCLAGTRLRLFGTIYPDPTQLREGGAVAALVRSHLLQKEPHRYGRS